MKTELRNCSNCGEALNGIYCSNCGQKQLTAEDKKLKHFFIEFFSSLFFADGKLLRTFKALLFQPGKLGNAYVKGIRKRYLSPLQVFFFANLIYFLVPHFNTFDTELETQLNSFFYSPLAKEAVMEHIAENNLEYEAYEKHYESSSTNNAKLLLIVLVLMQAVVLQLLFIRRKESYFIDYIGVMSYLNGFILLVFFVILSSLIAIMRYSFGFDLQFLDETALSLTIIFSILLYSFFLLKGSFEISKWKAFYKSLILAILFFQLVIFYRFFLFWVTFWVVS